MNTHNKVCNDQSLKNNTRTITKTHPSLSDLWLRHRKGVLFSMAIAILYVIPLVLADQYFEDDLLRVLDGEKWTGLGRFWTEYLAELLSEHPDTIVNLFPFSLIFSAALLGLTGYLITYILGIESKGSYTLSSIVLITSPFFLQNLSYRFDLPSMALAQFLVILPFCFREKPYIFLLVGALGLYFTCGLYQPTALTWFAMWLCMAMKQFLDERWRSLLIDSVVAIFAPIVAFSMYFLSLATFVQGLPDRATTIFSNPNFFQLLKERLHSYLHLLYTNVLDTNFTYNLTIFLIISIVGVFFVLYKNRLYERPILAIGALIFLGFGLILIWLLTGAINIIVEPTWWVSRVMLCLPFLIYFLLIWQRGLPVWVLRLGVICICYYSFLLCALYAQALKNRTDHELYLINLISPYLEQVDTRQIVIAGEEPTAPRNEVIFSNHPFIKGLVIPNLSEYNYFADFALIQYLQRDSFTFLDNSFKKQMIDSRCHIPVVADYHDLLLRKVNHTLIVDFNRYKGCNEQL